MRLADLAQSLLIVLFITLTILVGASVFNPPSPDQMSECVETHGEGFDYAACVIAYSI